MKIKDQRSKIKTNPRTQIPRSKYFGALSLGFWICFGFCVLSLGFLVMGCAQLKVFFNSSTTNLQSSSLAAASALRAQGITIAGLADGNNWLITPINISGEVMSIVLPINDQEDEGITPFGSGRPDIAPANSTLYPFDLSQVTTLTNDTVSTKPGFVGGTCEAMIIMFGYFDVAFDQGGTQETIRMVYGDTDPYVRGDKLFYNASEETTGLFYWYSTGEGKFVAETASRPADAVVNEFVRDFQDESGYRDQMHYYMLGATLRNNTDYDGTVHDWITLSKEIVTDYDLSFTVDFDVQNCVVFTNTTSAEFDSLTDAQLIERFDMKQNTQQGWSDCQVYCSITFEATPKY